ncbi:RNA polymerase sigma factor [Phaeovulum sp.]|uniref:RNA polymerase sigma factor n=1 Tax=Phaeovulum sp. TaxID=2934796 RepID=UPI0039E68CA7
MQSKPLASTTAYSDLPEADLVAQARVGNNLAIRELIRRCNQRLFRVARGIVKNDAEAEDVVQAAYVAAFTKLETFRGEAAFATWVTRITMNEAFGRRRSHHSQARIVDLAEYREKALNAPEGGMHDPMTPTPPTPESELARAEARKFLEQAIDTLPDPLRVTYIMRDVQELTTREVADLLDISAVTVKTRIFRARRLLRAKIQKGMARKFSDIFPFDGQRCVEMADRVIATLAARRLEQDP